MTLREINQAYFVKYDKEFEVEMDQDEIVVVNWSHTHFSVNILQSPGNIVCIAIGESMTEATSRASAIACALNSCGL